MGGILLLSLLLCLSWSCFSSSKIFFVRANADGKGGLRRKLQNTMNNGNSNNNNNNEQLELFIPSFSQDEDSIEEVDMPTLTLLMEGLVREGKENINGLGDVAYDAIQTTMNSYLEKLLEEFFDGKYDFVKARTEIIDGRPFYDEESSEMLEVAGTAITMETTLTFRDDSSEEEGIGDNNDGGERKQAASIAAASTRDAETDDDDNKKGKSIPTDLEIDLVAGLAWNDLMTFQNLLLVQAFVEDIDTFDTLTSIRPYQDFPVSVPPGSTAEEIAAAVDGNGEEDEATKPDRGGVSNVNDNEKKDFNVAAATEASSQLSQKSNGKDRMSPLWPALIVGLTVFLCTIIMLGYRRQRSIRRGESGGCYKRSEEEDDDDDIVRVNTNDLSLDNEQEGDEEFEVESIHPHNKKEKKNKNKDYERKSWRCSKTKKLRCGTSYNPESNINTTILIDEEDRQGYDTADHIAYRGIDSDGESINDSDGIGRRSCFNFASSRYGISASKREPHIPAVQIIDEVSDNDGGDNGSCNSENSRSIDMTKSKNYQRGRRGQSWRMSKNPDGIVDEYGDDDVCTNDLNPSEKEKFVDYMKIGLSLEEASQRVLSERPNNGRNNNNINSSSSSPNRTTTQQQRQRSSRSHHHPGMKSEVMGDGQTTVHYDTSQNTPDVCCDLEQSGGGGGGNGSGGVHVSSNGMMTNPCSANNYDLLKNVDGYQTKSGTGTITGTGPNNPMVISDVASNVSSSYTYNDSDFSRVLEDLEATEHSLN